MSRHSTNFLTRFFAFLVVGLLLFSAAATEALVAHSARGSAPAAVVLRNGAQQHGTTATGVGHDTRTYHPFNPHDALGFPANLSRVGGR